MTLREAFLIGRKELELKNDYQDIDFSETDVYELMEKFFSADRNEIYLNPDKEINGEIEPYISALKKRKEHYPLQYILGYWYFMGMKLTVKDGALSPRDDTEVVCSEAIKYIKNNKYKGLDLCSGTGCIALGVAENCPNAEIEAIELFDVPFSCLEENCQKYGGGRVKPLKLDILSLENAEKYKGKNLDFITANPPYIKLDEMPTVQEEVKSEPREALTDEGDGLSFYRFIVENWKYALRKGGLLAFEIGETEAEDICNMMLKNGFSSVRVIKDIQNLDRSVVGILD